MGLQGGEVGLEKHKKKLKWKSDCFVLSMLSDLFLCGTRAESNPPPPLPKKCKAKKLTARLTVRPNLPNIYCKFVLKGFMSPVSPVFCNVLTEIQFLFYLLKIYLQSLSMSTYKLGS